MARAPLVEFATNKDGEGANGTWVITFDAGTGEPVTHPPGWLTPFVAQCESPAELSFLAKLLAAFELGPGDGALVGPGLRVQLQAPKLKYRLDFLVNAHHAIEIDGADYHSSDYDRGMDALRDAELSHIGIKVLRLPAKLVMNDADEVIRQVQAFLADAAPAARMVLPDKPKTPFAIWRDEARERADEQRHRTLAELMAKGEEEHGDPNWYLIPF